MSENQKFPEERELVEDGGELSAEEIAEFEELAESIADEVKDIEGKAMADMHASVSFAAADADDSDPVSAAMAEIEAAQNDYRVVDLRGRFCPAWSSWGNSGKTYGVVAHYNGGPVPARAWNYPLAWMKFISDLHAQNGRFARGWKFNGIAYHEWCLGRTVYRLRNYAADTPHCGNLRWNRNSLGLHIPVGGSQRPIDAARGTLNTALRRADDHLQAMKKGRTALKGHQEVGASNCPGPHIMAGIRGYRAGADLGNGGEKPPDLVHRVIAGAFSSPVNAAKRERELQAKGFAAWSYEHEGVTRVQAGSFDSRKKADDFVRQLSRARFDAFIASESPKA